MGSSYLGPDVQPGPVLRDPLLPLRGLRARVIGLDERADGEAPQHNEGEDRSHPLQFGNFAGERAGRRVQHGNAARLRSRRATRGENTNVVKITVKTTRKRRPRQDPTRGAGAIEETSGKQRAR